MTRIKTKSITDSKTSKRPVKVAGYSSDVLRATKAAKRAEAEERQARYDGFTLKEKTDRAIRNRGNSTRELARLKTKAA